ncbi:hypothetical protein E7T09_01965 [Deinococcus sp. KSM4-11]|uniref:hypothetical protein n=1 Tax=Deinococcus sp. KSM4-11 TaxID=2568654 RepID=UPI0010A48339|nr:hypothetical protein [Deinococcus sp. KSM4-11]THF88013.1 hypothetical protein E7T09_01965 [Deinococcus sp. KSM4-11]
MTEPDSRPQSIERVQTGIRVEKRLLKVLKGLAEYLDLSLSDLVEGMALHALDGKAALTNPDTLNQVERLRAVYGLTLRAEDSHRLVEDAHDDR